MIALSPQSRSYVAVEPVDFRKGIRGLKSICRNYLQQDSDSGVLFLFRNRRMDTIKILVYDGQGYWLMQKRLSRGKFPWWPEAKGKGTHLNYKKLQLIINVALDTRFDDDWKRVF